MTTATLIDSHCHLDFESFDNDREQVIQRAKDNHILDIVIPGTEKVFWERINKLCTKYKQLHPCYGLHPYWVNNHDKQDVDSLSKYIENTLPVAIGECGLDFRDQQADKKTQLYFFEAQLEIANNHQLPVVIHSVKATETAILSIKKFKDLKGMIHSYSGSIEQARQLIDLGFFISVCGSVTYDNAKTIKSVVKEIPLTSLLLETDSPDQADKKNMNKRNEPAYLINTLDAISKLRDTSQTMIAQQTTKNAKGLFKI
ncbi:MAG: TatD family hydrolase [Gammaproteobacteria bacterium]|nr:TatD family hydrolase [Gammaproteobacteria bacterium]